MPRFDYQRVLVRGANWIGDAIMTTPALAALGDNLPRARVTVLAKPWVAPVYEHHPAVHDVMIFDREGRHRGLGGLWRLAREIRERRYDLAVLFQNAFQAALIARLAGVPERMGYDTDGRRLLLNRVVRMRPEDKRVHETLYYLRILERSGFKTTVTPPVFHISEKAEQAAMARLKDLGLDGSFLVGLAPGAAYGPAKQWPADRFARAADLVLKETQGAALVFGGAGEKETADRVRQHMSAPAVDLAGATGLAEAAALIRKCRLFISNDSGLMHLAAAVGVPLVAVFGSTNPVTTSPVGPAVRMIRHPVACSPCLKQVCGRPTHECMDLVTPEEVASAGLELLSQGGA